jgi:hypothetical protein
VLSDRGAAIDGEQLKTLSIEMERPVVQRLGYLLDRLGHDQVSNSMYSSLVATGTPRWTELDRTEASDNELRGSVGRQRAFSVHAS